MYIYIDDILCIGNQQSFKSFTYDIQKHFKIVQEESIELYVGCEIQEVNKDELVVRQSNLIKKLEKFQVRIANYQSIQDTNWYK